MNLNQKKQLLMGSIVLGLVLVFFFLQGLDSSIKESHEKGNINIQEDDEILIDPYNETWKKADEKEEMMHPYSVGIHDPKGYLIQEGFLSTKAHFLKCDEIGEYLKDNGCYSSNIEIISAYKEKNNSYFTARLIDVPDKMLEVIWYGMTEEFSFSLKEMDSISVK